MRTANSGCVLRLNRQRARACLFSFVHDCSSAENVRVEPVYVYLSVIAGCEMQAYILIGIDEVGVLDVFVYLE
jgi:hypothetical protein